MSSPAAKYLGQTVDVKAAHAFDAGMLRTFLGDSLPGFAGPLSVRQFDGGQSNPTYLLETPARRYVLRRQPPGKLLKSAHAVDREFRVMRALFEAGFPVPEPLVLCEDASVIGTMFYVMAHVPGRVFLDCTMPDLSREDRAAVFDSVNETLARLHSLDHVALGLSDFGSPGNYFARQIARWTRQCEQSMLEPIPELEKLMAWLPGAIPQEDEIASVIHGDYSFHNVLIHPEQPRVVAVVDWELSTIGHPLGDLMYHTMDWYRPAGISVRNTLADKDLVALGVPDFESYVRRYFERTGTRCSGNLAFYRAYNLFRVAAIVQGIASRQREGNAASSNVAQVATSVRPLASAAWREAQKAGAV
jgi:aminoglycoside phosphotransferase (APT) family kinase protein